MCRCILFVLGVICFLDQSNSMSLLRGIERSRVPRSPRAVNHHNHHQRGTQSRLSHNINRGSSTNVDRFYATTFGEGHVITFDGRHYAYPMVNNTRSCPHVLARDHQQYRFIIIQKRQSITVYLPHVVVTVHHNNKVEVNNAGIYRDQPIQSSDGTVSVTHNNLEVTIKTSIGVVVQCDIRRERCFFVIGNGFYNSSAGLLGTNDNVASNDFMLRSGESAGSIQDFINYYELSGLESCRPQSPGTPETRCPSSESRQECQHLFYDSTSPLALCFGAVRPEPYLEACYRDASSCGNNNVQVATCSSAKSYAKMCNAHGISLQLPQACVSCGSHAFGETWHEQPKRKLDIVILTSLGSDMALGNNNLGTMIDNLFTRAKNVLRTRTRVQNIKVGLLGFGGEGALADPHVYTFQGESFTRHYNTAMWNNHLESLTTNGAGGHVHDALQTTLYYPYRDNAVKMVILITGSQQSLDHTRTRNVISKLQSRGIILNVVTRTNPTTENTYASRHRNNRVAEMVRSTGGSTFDLDQLATSNNHALTHTANQIHQQMTRVMHRCRECQCSYGEMSEGTTTCSSYNCSQR